MFEGREGDRRCRESDEPALARKLSVRRRLKLGLRDGRPRASSCSEPATLFRLGLLLLGLMLSGTSRSRPCDWLFFSGVDDEANGMLCVRSYDGFVVAVEFEDVRAASCGTTYVYGPSSYNMEPPMLWPRDFDVLGLSDFFECRLSVDRRPDIC